MIYVDNRQKKIEVDNRLEEELKKSYRNLLLKKKR